MEKKEKIILINKKPVTGSLLYKQACELTDLSQEVRVITDYLDHINYSAKQGDKFALNNFVESSSLGNIVDVLQNIQDELDKVSNSICPDEI
ncbi:MAG: hypothetical protein ABF630_09815 [Liquorilactobacillus sp.]